MSSIAHPPVFSIKSEYSNKLTLESREGHVVHIFVLENNLFRILLLPDGQLNFPKTWAIAPGLEDISREGRFRFDLSGFSLPPYEHVETEGVLCIATPMVRLTIQLAGFFCHWEIMKDGRWVDAANDRPTQSYNFGCWDEKVYHYLKRNPDEMYFGLGERAGDSNRAGQRYRLCNVDAMGYSAKTSDPLYKHIPFYLTWRKETQSAFGLFYDTLSDCSFDFGKEMDNYHGHYRYFVADHGDLDYYFIAGPTPAAVTQCFTWMTGQPAFTPKWGLGYSGSTMSYTDAPNAQERMNEFLEGCHKHDIPCDSFHLSSGYTSINGKRYVFNWNRDKFPDPAGFAKHYLDHGVRLCANIKPCLLHDHPRYEEVREAGLFISEPDGTPTEVQFWDETGSYIDFTHPVAYDWWKARVTDSLLEYGITSTWNDNNEFEIWSKTPLANFFGSPRPAHQVKPLQTLLMIRASSEAQKAHAPNQRPYLISRSGTTGMQRYVQTWSGDNCTSWETLRYNIRMATGLSISGVSNIGHDIGGFSGPKPEQELLLRWVQHGIFLPRFSIHSWNDDQSANEPWMYPEITPHIRELIRLRYRLIPFLYDLLWRSHSRYEPILRPIFYNYPEDPNCFIENDDMMLGDKMLVSSVVEPGQTNRAVYLPSGNNWHDYWSGTCYAGGQTVTLPAGQEEPPLLIKEASIIPLNLAEQHFSQVADERGFVIFPAKDTHAFHDEFYEDDGESEKYREGYYGLWRLDVVGSDIALKLSIAYQGSMPQPGKKITLLFPRQEMRTVHLENAQILTDSITRQWRKIVCDL